MVDPVKHVHETLKHNVLFSSGSRLLLGVSGGIDSVALFHIFRRIARLQNITLAAAHFNHLLRSRDSKEDARFVHQLCEQYKLPLYSGEENILDRYQQTPGKSLEEVARERRFEFFWNSMRQHRSHYLILGHTADDQAETFFMRLLQGSGCHGLSGISFLQDFPQGKVVHPLLDIEKETLRSFLEENDYTWREDTSNLNTVFFRNQIRLELLSLLKRFNPRIKDFALKYTEYFRELKEYVGKSYPAWEKEAADILSPDRFSWRPGIISSWPSFKQKEFIHLFFKIHFQRTLKSVQVEQIQRFLEFSQSGKSLSILEHICLEKEYGSIFIYRGKKSTPGACAPLVITTPGTYKWNDWIIRVNAEDGPDKRINTIAVPAGEKYEIRSFIPGDRITLFPRNITKKIKKIFQEYRTPVSQRKDIPLLYSPVEKRILAIFLSEKTILSGIPEEFTIDNNWLVQVEKNG